MQIAQIDRNGLMQTSFSSRGASAFKVATSSKRRSTIMAALSQDELKRQAAWKAVDYVKSNMVVGLGTGSTAAFAVDRIGELLKNGTLKNIIGVPTSIRTYEQAKSLGIPLAVKLRVALTSPGAVDEHHDVAHPLRHWMNSPTLTSPSMAQTKSIPTWMW